MKKSILLLIVTILTSTLTACGSKEKVVNLKKSGDLYTTEDGVSFYYPKDYQITVTANPDSLVNNIVEFSSENNTLYFMVISDESDNEVMDRDELYTGELEQAGASEIEVSKPVLDSGLDVYQYRYEYSETGTMNKEIVYFTEDFTYIYGYRSIGENFDEYEKNMTVYLDSFSMTSGK